MLKYVGLQQHRFDTSRPNSLIYFLLPVLMILPSTENHIAVIIAYRGSDRHLLDSFLDLKLWFSDITIVGLDCAAISDGNNYVFFRDVPCRDLFLTRCFTPKNCKSVICEDHPVAEVVKKSLELLRT